MFMLQPHPFTDHEQAHLAELAEMDMALARHAHAHALASDEPAVIAELGRTYQRFARSARQSLALSAKLRRDAARDAAEAAGLARREALLRPWTHDAQSYADDDFDDEVLDDEDDEDVAPDDNSTPTTAPDPTFLQREAELRNAVRRLIWAERERLETDETPDDLFALLDERLESRRCRPKPCDQPLDEDVTALCAALGLPTDRAATWRDLPEAPEPPDGEDAPPPDPGDPEPQPQSSA